MVSTIRQDLNLTQKAIAGANVAAVRSSHHCPVHVDGQVISSNTMQVHAAIDMQGHGTLHTSNSSFLLCKHFQYIHNALHTCGHV